MAYETSLFNTLDIWDERLASFAIIEQHDWVFPNGLPDQLTFCQLERKHTAALLPLRAIGPRAFPVEGDNKGELS